MAFPYKDLVIGDPYTLIRDEPIILESGEHASVGDHFSRRFDTSEPGRVFRITRITKVTDSIAYESVFIGFEIVKSDDDGNLTTTIEPAIPTEEV